RRHTRFSRDWSSDVCSSDLTRGALRDVLGYRLYYDLRRGWRITSPNLEQLQLLEIGYRGLVECCQDEAEWEEAHPLLRSLSPERSEERRVGKEGRWRWGVYA